MAQGSQTIRTSGPVASPIRQSSTSPSASLRRVLGRDGTTAWLFLAPCMVVIIGLIAYPFFSAILLSFQAKLVGAPGAWVGLQNYQELLFGRDVGGVFRQSVV